MFQPSQPDVRRFFCTSPARPQSGLPFEPVEALAARWIAEHPGCYVDLADEATALRAVYTVENGRTIPFLHLSMHVSLDGKVFPILTQLALGFVHTVSFRTSPKRA